MVELPRYVFVTRKLYTKSEQKPEADLFLIDLGQDNPFASERGRTRTE